MNPAEARARLFTVAVTGTNGKTTTTSMVDAIVAASGEPSARVTTLGSWVAGQQLSDATDLDAFFRATEAAVFAGVKTLALETTSKALRDGFAHRWPADVAVFTNLSRDHFDYHESPEHYLAAKAQLFATLPPTGVAVLNASDPASALLLDVLPPGVRAVGFSPVGDFPGSRDDRLAVELRASDVFSGVAGTRIVLAPSRLASALGGELRLGVIGRVNADNALAAALAADAAGYAPEAIIAGLERFAGVPGRFEVVWHSPLVIVDYAHTPDALDKLLAQARGLGPGRLFCVFGCGGERDVGKRPEMGRAAARHADVVVLTNDNPRGEDPGEIARQVLAGVEEGLALAERTPRVVMELDRGQAIHRAIADAERERGDIVVIAGKGHERAQWIGGRSVEHSDADSARRACIARFGDKKAMP